MLVATTDSKVATSGSADPTPSPHPSNEKPKALIDYSCIEQCFHQLHLVKGQKGFLTAKELQKANSIDLAALRRVFEEANRVIQSEPAGFINVKKKKPKIHVFSNIETREHTIYIKLSKEIKASEKTFGKAIAILIPFDSAVKPKVDLCARLISRSGTAKKVFQDATYVKSQKWPADRVCAIRDCHLYQGKNGEKTVVYAQLFAKGNLTQALDVIGKGSLIIWLQTALSLQVLHKSGCVQGDVKPENFLMDEHNRVVVNDISAPGTNLYTPFYCSPEAVFAYCTHRRTPLTKENDIWALGVSSFKTLGFRHPIACLLEWAFILAKMNKPQEAKDSKDLDKKTEVAKEPQAALKEAEDAKKTEIARAKAHQILDAWQTKLQKIVFDPIKMLFGDENKSTSNEWDEHSNIIKLIGFYGAMGYEENFQEKVANILNILIAKLEALLKQIEDIPQPAEPFSALIWKIFRPNPSQRPTIDEVCKDLETLIEISGEHSPKASAFAQRTLFVRPHPQGDPSASIAHLLRDENLIPKLAWTYDTMAARFRAYPLQGVITHSPLEDCLIRNCAINIFVRDLTPFLNDKRFPKERAIRQLKEVWADQTVNVQQGLQVKTGAVVDGKDTKVQSSSNLKVATPSTAAPAGGELLTLTVFLELWNHLIKNRDLRILFEVINSFKKNVTKTFLLLAALIRDENFDCSKDFFNGFNKDLLHVCNKIKSDPLKSDLQPQFNEFLEAAKIVWKAFIAIVKLTDSEKRIQALRGVESCSDPFLQIPKPKRFTPDDPFVRKIEKQLKRLFAKYQKFTDPTSRTYIFRYLLWYLAISINDFSRALLKKSPMTAPPPLQSPLQPKGTSAGLPALPPASSPALVVALMSSVLGNHKLATLVSPMVGKKMTPEDFFKLWNRLYSQEKPSIKESAILYEQIATFQDTNIRRFIILVGLLQMFLKFKTITYSQLIDRLNNSTRNIFNFVNSSDLISKAEVEFNSFFEITQDIFQCFESIKNSTELKLYSSFDGIQQLQELRQCVGPLLRTPRLRDTPPPHPRHHFAEKIEAKLKELSDRYSKHSDPTSPLHIFCHLLWSLVSSIDIISQDILQECCVLTLTPVPCKVQGGSQGSSAGLPALSPGLGDHKAKKPPLALPSPIQDLPEETRKLLSELCQQGNQPLAKEIAATLFPKQKAAAEALIEKLKSPAGALLSPVLGDSKKDTALKNFETAR